MNPSNIYVEMSFAALMFDGDEQYSNLIAALSTYIDGTDDPGIAYHNRALAYWETGEVDNALSDFDEAERNLPRSHMPAQSRGLMLQKLGQFDAALASLDRAVAISPDEATVRRSRAYLFRDMGRLEEALEDFEHALGLEPGFTRTQEDRDEVVALLAEERGQRSR
jgi:tetratricopeptide (TPR) repeat protein